MVYVVVGGASFVQILYYQSSWWAFGTVSTNHSIAGEHVGAFLHVYLLCIPKSFTNGATRNMYFYTSSNNLLLRLRLPRADNFSPRRNLQSSKNQRTNRNHTRRTHCISCFSPSPPIQCTEYQRTEGSSCLTYNMYKLEYIYKAKSDGWR